ncbi:MAG: hypothetical protein H0Z24_06995 [Thermosipho sp. (in: Bacteria)]|nr:hypothetical protein [Thermosipho sp. (in: thermotogales)]
MKFKSAWELIKDYEKELRGLQKIKWKIQCFIDDIYIYVKCKFIRLFRK